MLYPPNSGYLHAEHKATVLKHALPSVMTILRRIFIRYLLGMTFLNCATKGNRTSGADCEDEACPIECSHLFCGISEDDYEAENVYSSHECRIFDECTCTTNMFVTCPKLSPHPFFMMYSSFSRQLTLSCGHLQKDLDTVTDYMAKFFNVLHIYSITIKKCCLIGDSDSAKDSVSYLKDSLSTLNASRLQTASQMYSMSLPNNCIRRLSDKFPPALKNLQELDLTSNMLQEIPEDAFYNLTSLECLKLDQNEINVITNSTFRGLRSLTSLSLSTNKLQNLSAEVFNELLNLETLDLGYNNLKSLPRDIFSKHILLKQLFLTANAIESLPAPIFKSLTKLVELRLNYNKLESISRDLFDGLTKLERVDLTYNRLKTIPSKIFRTNRDLLSVDLNGNNFGEFGLPELRLGAFTKRGPAKFNIANNNISVLDLPLTTRIRIASTLDLSSNCVKELRKAKSLSVKTFRGTGISEFICTNCCFKTVTNTFFQGVLTSADLSHNQIQTIDMNFLRSVAHLDRVDLSYNRITSINIDWSYPLIQDFNRKSAGNSVTTVVLQHNPIVCDCNLIPFLKFIANESEPPNGFYRSAFHFDVQDVVCAQPTGPLKGKRIHHMIQVKYFQDKFVCNETSDCPNGCDCYLKAFDKTLVLNCSHRSFEEFPTISEAGYSFVLHLENNLIRNLPSKYSSAWSGIKELYLDNNHLLSLENLTVTPNLTTLSLKDNLLTSFQPEIVFLLQSHDNVKLSLSGNPWECSCELRKLKPLLFTASNVLDSNLISCVFPQTGSLIILANATDFELCPEHHPSLFLMKVLLPTLSIFVVLASFATSLAYRYKSEMQLWLFTHGYCLRFVTEDDVDSHKLYDAFVSYSTKDESWVALKLVSGLENGIPPYKLCLHNRDWQVGEWIPEQILRSVECSRRTIIVLTDSFVESDWSRLEFQAAYRQALADQVNRILVVIPFNVPETRKLGSELSSFIRLNTYIQWDDPYFWRKLRCAMPRIKPSQGPPVYDKNNCKYDFERYFIIRNAPNDIQKQSSL